MSFSATFLAVIVYGALGWCALTAVGLGTLLIRDLLRGETW